MAYQGIHLEVHKVTTGAIIPYPIVTFNRVLTLANFDYSLTGSVCSTNYGTYHIRMLNSITIRTISIFT